MTCTLRAYTDEIPAAGSYHRWDWRKLARLGKLAAPAVAGQLAVGLQGAGLVYTSGAVPFCLVIVTRVMSTMLPENVITGHSTALKA